LRSRQAAKPNTSRSLTSSSQPSVLPAARPSLIPRSADAQETVESARECSGSFNRVWSRREGTGGAGWRTGDEMRQGGRAPPLVSRLRSDPSPSGTLHVGAPVVGRTVAEGNTSVASAPSTPRGTAAERERVASLNVPETPAAPDDELERVGQPSKRASYGSRATMLGALLGEASTTGSRAPGTPRNPGTPRSSGIP
jgi:hypothetical protein